MRKDVLTLPRDMQNRIIGYRGGKDSDGENGRRNGNLKALTVGSVLIAVITIGGAFVGAFDFFERFATKEDLSVIEKRLQTSAPASNDNKDLQQQIDVLSKRIRVLENSEVITVDDVFEDKRMNVVRNRLNELWEKHKKEAFKNMEGP